MIIACYDWCVITSHLKFGCFNLDPLTIAIFDVVGDMACSVDKHNLVSCHYFVRYDCLYCISIL